MQGQMEIDFIEAAKRNNFNLEQERNEQALKGGIPQSHKYQPKTAIEAFKELKVNDVHREILQLLRKTGTAMSDRQIKVALNRKDMNDVRPRISELVDFELIIKTGKIKDYESGRGVRVTRITEKGLTYIDRS